MTARRLLLRGVLLALIAATTLAPVVARAHPLGNFTINRYSRLEVGRDVVRVRYVLDVAEILAFTEHRAADTSRDGTVSEAEWEAYKVGKVAELRRNLELIVDGARTPLVTEEGTVSTPQGQANLPLVGVEAWFRADVPAGAEHRATYRERNELTRMGWREVLVWPGPGIVILRSTVPTDDISDELRAYPEDLLQSPLDRREAEVVFAAVGAAVDSPATVARDLATRPTDAFTSRSPRPS